MSKFLILFFLSFLTGCVMTRRIDKAYPEETISQPFVKGEYANCSDQGCGEMSYTLLDQLTFRLLKKDSLENWDNLVIKLTREDNFLNIQAFDSGDLVNEQRLKGKWKDNKFFSKRMIRPIGLPFVFFWYYEKKIILSWEENKIVLSNGECKIGMIFIMSGGNTEYTWNKYNALNK